MSEYWLETLGCPKNQVDSDKLEGRLLASGYDKATSADTADLVVVNTCAFIEAAREESIDTILELSAEKRAGSRLVVTGCMAQRYGQELADALTEVDLVAPFGVELDQNLAGRAAPNARGVSTPVRFTKVPSFDLLELPRPKPSAPWAYVKAAEGCDRKCGFCAIPTFRGPQRSRSMDSIVAEAMSLDVSEVVLVAQDLASWSKDRSSGTPRGAGGNTIVHLVDALAQEIPWVRLLYLYPSSVDDRLIEAIVATGVSYFDLSLQHASRPLLKRMRRWGDGEKFLSLIDRIRIADPSATLRSSFVVGYPGESEEDHDQLLEFLSTAQLDWAGFFPYSSEAGTFAAGLDDLADPALVAERVAECSELQEGITFAKRRNAIGRTLDVLVDSVGVARSVAEAPEIDGIIEVPHSLEVGKFASVVITDAAGPDLQAIPVAAVA